jgi:hypothetical protein
MTTDSQTDKERERERYRQTHMREEEDAGELRNDKDFERPKSDSKTRKISR